MDVLLMNHGIEGIGQNIRTILLTNKGEVPFKPEMGVGSITLLDRNLDRMKISLEIANQINTYEPRVNVQEVLFLQGENIGHLNLLIKYKIKETGDLSAYILNN